MKGLRWVGHYNATFLYKTRGSGKGPGIGWSNVRRKYALESNVCNPAAGFKSKQKITTAYLLQRKNPVNYSLLIKYFKGRLRSHAVRLRRRLRGDTWLADTDAFSHPSLFFLLKPEKPRGWGSGHLSLLNFIFSTTFKKENLPNSLQILRNVFIKWSYRLFSVKGCSSLKRKFCTSCAYRRTTHAAGLAAHSEVRRLFSLVTQGSTQVWGGARALRTWQTWASPWIWLNHYGRLSKLSLRQGIVISPQMKQNKTRKLRIVFFSFLFSFNTSMGMKRLARY